MVWGQGGKQRYHKLEKQLIKKRYNFVLFVLFVYKDDSGENKRGEDTRCVEKGQAREGRERRRKGEGRRFENEGRERFCFGILVWFVIIVMMMLIFAFLPFSFCYFCFLLFFLAILFFKTKLWEHKFLLVLVFILFYFIFFWINLVVLE